MKVYVVMWREDFANEVSAVFLDKKKAEAYLLQKAVEDMDYCQIESQYRHCEYQDEDLIEIYDDDYYCRWWIEEHTIKED